jgi:hypothetical protein
MEKTKAIVCAKYGPHCHTILLSGAKSIIISERNAIQSCTCGFSEELINYLDSDTFNPSIEHSVKTD